MRSKSTGVVLLTLLCAATLCFSQTIPQQEKQDPLMYFGTQIGNELDTTSTGCWIGTAGTLLTDGTHDYILSNSHVLAREGAGVIGEDIMHTASSYCVQYPVHVGELAADVPLKFGRRNTNRVDAALARITPDVFPAVDPFGRVLHIANKYDFTDAYGVSDDPVDATFGMDVKKSGRTTGLTYGSISDVNVNVAVRYSSGIAYFTGQFVVSGGSFSAGGDSGSLIVTDDDAADPVGLLFAGSANSTIGNPIDEVLSLLDNEVGESLRFGTSAKDYGTWELIPPPDGGGGGGKGGGKGGKKKSGIIRPGIERATEVRDRNEAWLNRLPGVVGSGIGSENGTPRITLFLDKPNPALERALPRQLDGVDLNVRVTGEFVAY